MFIVVNLGTEFRESCDRCHTLVRLPLTVLPRVQSREPQSEVIFAQSRNEVVTVRRHCPDQVRDKIRRETGSNYDLVLCFFAVIRIRSPELRQLFCCAAARAGEGLWIITAFSFGQPVCRKRQLKGVSFGSKSLD